MCNTGIGVSTVRFQTLSELLKNKDNFQFSIMLKSIACLYIMAEAGNGHEILQLVEMVHRLTVQKKALNLITPSLDLELLENTTINFDIMINHTDRGRIESLEKTKGENVSISIYFDFLNCI